MKRSNHASVVRLTSLALLAALVVVLQTVASGIRIGPVPISLTLVPIVVGAILFGPGAGAGLGAVFGIVCLIAGIIVGSSTFQNTGAEPAVGISTDNRQYGKGYQTEDHEYQQDRSGADIHTELFFL